METLENKLAKHFKDASIVLTSGYVKVHVTGEISASTMQDVMILGFEKLKRSGSGITLYFKD